MNFIRKEKKYKREEDQESPTKPSTTKPEKHLLNTKRRTYRERPKLYKKLTIIGSPTN